MNAIDLARLAAGVITGRFGAAAGSLSRVPRHASAAAVAAATVSATKIP
jgi:hypothetical protein